jgi:hypothetical protein
MSKDVLGDWSDALVVLRILSEQARKLQNRKYIPFLTPGFDAAMRAVTRKIARAETIAGDARARQIRMQGEETLAALRAVVARQSYRPSGRSNCLRGA